MLHSSLLRSPGEISSDLSAQGRERLSHILSNLVKQETRDTWLVHRSNEIHKNETPSISIKMSTKWHNILLSYRDAIGDTKPL